MNFLKSIGVTKLQASRLHGNQGFKLIVVLFVITALTGACKRVGSSPDSTEIIILKDWKYTNPFEDTALISYVNYLDVLRDTSNPVFPTPAKLLHQETDHFNFSEFFHRPEKSMQSIYVSTEVNSPTEQDVVLMSNICQVGSLWVNGKFQQQISFQRNINRLYRNYTPIRLKKGSNVIAFKISVFDVKTPYDLTHWKLMAAISSFDYAIKKYAIDYRFDFIKKSLLSDGDSVLQLYVPVLPESKTLELQIESDSGIQHVLARRNTKEYFKLNVAGFSKGFYEVRFSLNGQVFKQDFFKGDISQFCSIEVDIKEENNIERKTIKALSERLKNLLDTYNLVLASDSLHYNSLKVYMASGIKKWNDYVKKSKTPSGLTIHSYTSEIDSSLQHYTIHIPDHLIKSGSRIPLVCAVPYNFNSNPKALKSYYFSNLIQLKWDSELAEDIGAGIVFPFFRGDTYGNYIAEKDFHEVMKDVSKKYNIDTTRFYLLGDCTGGTKALQLAAHFPHYFAGVAVYGPAINTLPRKTLREKSMSPLDIACNLANTPIYIYHSTNDEISPVINSDSLSAALRKYNGVFTYTREVGPTHYTSPKDFHRDGVNFFKDKIRLVPEQVIYRSFEKIYTQVYDWKFEFINESKPATLLFDFQNEVLNSKSQNVKQLKKTSLHYSRLMPNYKTPLFYKADKFISYPYVFSNRFYLVEPDTTDNRSKQRLAFKTYENFMKHWEKKYFTTPLKIHTSDITTNLIAQCNLVIFSKESV